MAKDKEPYIPISVRLSEDTHVYLRAESARLGVSINALINILIDDGRRMKEGTLFLSASISPIDKSANAFTVD